MHIKNNQGWNILHTTAFNAKWKVCIVIERYDAEELNYSKRLTNDKEVRGRYPVDLLAVRDNQIYLGNIWTAAYNGNFPQVMKYLDIQTALNKSKTEMSDFPNLTDVTPLKGYTTLQFIIEGAYYNFIEIVKPKIYNLWERYEISDFGIKRKDGCYGRGMNKDNVKIRYNVLSSREKKEKHDHIYAVRELNSRYKNILRFLIEKGGNDKEKALKRLIKIEDQENSVEFKDLYDLLI